MASKMSLPFGKKNAAPTIPSKTTMNLAIREVNAADRKSNIIIAVVTILAILLLGKFGFLDVYSEWLAANDAKDAAQQELNDVQMLLATYQNAADRYSHYYNSFLTDEEQALLDRIDLLDMMQIELFNQAHMVSVTVHGSEVTTQFSGVTLQQAGVLQAHLLQNPMVEDAFYTVAQTDKKENGAGTGENKEIVITMTLKVKQPPEDYVLPTVSEGPVAEDSEQPTESEVSAP